MLSLSGLVVLLAAVLVILLAAFFAARDRYFDSALPAVPSDRQVIDLLRQKAPSWRWERQLHRPGPPPRSGVVRADLLRGETGEAGLLVALRHDIACVLCNDLLVAVLLDPATRRIHAVEAMVPWELKGEPLDAAPFLAQLTGRMPVRMVAGRDLDGISGATLSVEGMLHELAAVGKWLDEADLLEGLQ